MKTILKMILVGILLTGCKKAPVIQPILPTIKTIQNRDINMISGNGRDYTIYRNHIYVKTIIATDSISTIGVASIDMIPFYPPINFNVNDTLTVKSSSPGICFMVTKNQKDTTGQYYIVFNTLKEDFIIK